MERVAACAWLGLGVVAIYHLTALALRWGRSAEASLSALALHTAVTGAVLILGVLQIKN